MNDLLQGSILFMKAKSVDQKLQDQILEQDDVYVLPIGE